MNLSLKLKTQTQNSNGESPLFIRLRMTINNIDMESSIHTGIDLLPKFFRNGNILHKTPDFLVKQKIINSIYRDIERIIGEIKDDGIEPNPSLVKSRYSQSLVVKENKSPIVKTFWKSFDEFFNTKKHKSRGYVKTFITLKNRLIEFEEYNKTKITFDLIIGNPIKFQFELQDFFWEKKKLSNGYINKLLENLSQFFYYCFQQGYISKKPVFRKNDEIERDEKIYLYKDEVIKLFKSKKWNYEEGKDFSSNPHIYIIEDLLEGTRKEEFGKVRKITNWEFVKDVFVFQCSIGCRYSDIPFFKVHHFDFDSNTKSFTWIQQKTDKRVSVPVNDISGSIYQKYSSGKSLSQNLFPHLSIQKFNKTLKYLLQDLKFNRLVNYPKKIGSKVVNNEDRFLWELISSHSGRRTFIKNMIDIGTMDYKTIMTMSGHKTIKEFEKYVSVSPHDLKKGMKLYQLENPQTEMELDELVKRYLELDDEKKKIVLQLVRTIS
jgi:integrase